MSNKLIFNLEYDGTNFHGWQMQKNGSSVQGEIEKVLNSLFEKEINLIGAGRTDTGVHASNYIAHCDVDFEIKIPIDKLTNVLNSLLNDEIIIKSIILVNSSEFHSRFSAIARQYGYFIHLQPSVFLNRFSTYVNYQLDTELLFDISSLFLGENDFTAFSKKNEDTKSYICDVSVSKWDKIDDSRYKYTIKADRFVYGMVRAIVGAMIDVARKKKTIDDIEDSFKKGTRNNISPLAPPQGLILEKIYYPKNFDYFK